MESACSSESRERMRLLGKGRIGRSGNTGETWSGSACWEIGCVINLHARSRVSGCSVLQRNHVSGVPGVPQEV